MLSDAEKGNNLMLTRLTPVAALIDTEQQQPLALARKHGRPQGGTKRAFAPPGN